MDYLAKEAQKIKEEKQKRMKNLAELEHQTEQRKMQKEVLKTAQKKWRQEAEEDAARYREEQEDKKKRSVENMQRFNDERREHLELARQRDKMAKQAEHDRDA